MEKDKARYDALSELDEYARENIAITKRIIAAKASLLGIENIQDIEKTMNAAVSFAFEPTAQEAQAINDENNRVDNMLDRAFGTTSKNMSEDEKLDAAFGIKSE
ncbi:MAG: hypothetical protein RSB25_21255 [Acinetobacter sp.]